MRASGPVSAGRVRSAPGTGVLRRLRLRKGRQRAQRGRRIVKAAKNKVKATGIFTAGVARADAYGSEVAGLADGELAEHFRSVIAGFLPHSSCVSMWEKLLLYHVPGWEAAVAPLLHYQRLLQQVVVAPATACATLGTIRGWWKDSARAASRHWRFSRGPVNACLLSLRRIGWDAKGALVWVNDVGDGMSLLTTSVAAARRTLHDGVARWV